MTVSLKKSLTNLVKDKNFLSKYTVLVVISFCCGLITFASIAKNYPLIVPSFILAIFASCFALGYDLEYIKSLIENEDADMPEWSRWGEYFKYGLKYIGAVVLLALAILAGLMLFVLLGFLITMKSKLLMILVFAIAMVILFVIEIFMLFGGLGFTYLFIDSDYDILSLFNIKKVFSYFSTNYFVALFGMCMLASINGVLATFTTINIKYALFYIVPLLIAPFIRMWSNNLIAQAYRANKNEETGSVWKVFLFAFVSIVMFTIILAMSISSSIPVK